ncbi:MAG: UDP-glucose 4-epimerase GalE, partial [Alphaproteobacteria bacterium]
FAGSIIVSESVEQPLAYYQNNVAKSVTLIDACLRHNVNDFIFSSSAAVYGIPEGDAVYEDTPTNPINPYGQTKLMVEAILHDASKAHGLRFGALRYFNVAGADPKGRTGESPPHATHLIKIAAQHTAGKRDKMYIFGEDYPTPDGTCIRDYVHVTDLALAHLAVLDTLGSQEENLVLNCGTGHGFSVKEVLDVVKTVADRPLNIISAARREGDPPILVANADRLHALTGWDFQYDDLQEIIRSAIKWEETLTKRQNLLREDK